jgi:ferredoxin
MLQMEPRVPRTAWLAIRAVTIAAAPSLIGALFADPTWALSIFWGIFIPLAPLLFFLAPGLWRNICPLAAVNQIARVFRFSRGLTLPRPLVEHGYLIPVVMLFGLIPARRVLFNTSGPAVGALLLGVGALAFFGAIALKGKSGWCSTFCPLLPVQRIYGQTPFAIVRNSHCEPCLGCAKNCFDFNPQVAQFADLYDDNPVRPAYRKLFVGAFPGLVLAYFTVGNHGVLRTYELFAIVVLASAGLFLLLDSVVRISTATIPTLFAAAALNVYYWYSFPRLAQRLAHAQSDWWVWGSRSAIAVLSLIWVAWTLRSEERFLEVAASVGGVRLGAGAVSALRDSAAAADVTVLPQQRRIAVDAGATLLEVIEKDGLSIEAGRRMSMCGADPICVLDGADSLSPIGDDERSTLERLGLADSTRMACCARVRGPVSISLTPERRIAAAGAGPAEGVAPGIERVVIVGNGIAGTTAADYVRRRHGTCSIDLVAREEHFLYNRMAISRLVYGRSAMQRGLGSADRRDRAGRLVHHAHRRGRDGPARLRAGVGRAPRRHRGRRAARPRGGVRAAPARRARHRAPTLAAPAQSPTRRAGQGLRTQLPGRARAHRRAGGGGGRGARHRSRRRGPAEGRTDASRGVVPRLHRRSRECRAGPSGAARGRHGRRRRRPHAHERSGHLRRRRRRRVQGPDLGVVAHGRRAGPDRGAQRARRG